MRKAGKGGSVTSGSLGTGYVSIIMIFVVISLTVLAALSFSASGMNSGQGERARDFMVQYYEAETRADRTLMQLDEAAYEAHKSGLFMTFEMSAAETEGAAVMKSPEGYTVSWSEQVSERVTLSCEAVFFSQPELHDNKRFEITKWDTVSGGEADIRINVWDGTF